MEGYCNHDQRCEKGKEEVSGFLSHLIHLCVLPVESGVDFVEHLFQYVFDGELKHKDVK